jgi:Uma2 family endonuclease
MPTVLEQPAFVTTSPSRKRWTLAECRRLADAGFLDWERYELVEGDLIDTMGKGRRHVNTQRNVVLLLGELFGPKQVDSEAPIEVPGKVDVSEPQPDAVYLKREFSTFSTTPRPEDIHLIVEVSDSTLLFDLTAKARLYAGAGIPEYWVVDPESRRLIVHRDPKEGVYSSVVAYDSSESVIPLSAPGVSLAVASLFPDAI